MASLTSGIENYFQFKSKVKWTNVISMGIFHFLAVYAVLFAVPKATWKTLLLNYLIHLMAGYCVTLGTHRLWCHNAYKATLPMRVVLMIGHIYCGLYSLVKFVHDHRIHHKYVDTDADPHNAKRGFFYSHVGWLLMERLPENKSKRDQIDLRDVYADPVVRFQEKYFYQLFVFFNIMIPVGIPYLFFGETLKNSILIGFFLRLALILNSIWSLNSAAHLFGDKPYNKNIMASSNKMVTFLTVGEGWHNFHHVFPWDCRIGEFSSGFQLGTMLLQICSWLGFAYDLKFASPDLIEKAKKRSAKEVDFVDFADPHIETKAK